MKQFQSDEPVALVSIKVLDELIQTKRGHIFLFFITYQFTKLTSKCL